MLLFGVGCSCVLLAVCGLRFAVCCLWFVRWLSFVACCLLVVVVRCLWCLVCPCLSFAVSMRSVLLVVSRLLSAVRCLLFAVGSM